MAGTVKYMSPEWRDEAEKRLKSELTPEKMKHITTSMCCIYQNCPDGKQRYYFVKTENGSLVEVSIGDQEPPKAEFILTADYETFAKLTRGELSGRAALMGRKLTLSGNLIKALKLSTIADRMNKVLSTIPAEY